MQHSSSGQGGRIGGSIVSDELSVPLKSISVYVGGPPGHSRYSTANIAVGEAFSSVPLRVAFHLKQKKLFFAEIILLMRDANLF